MWIFKIYYFIEYRRGKTLYSLVWLRADHRVHAEWQRPHSGVHSIMMEKLAGVGEGMHAHHLSLNCIYYHVLYEVAVYAPAERTDTYPHPFVISSPKYSVGTTVILVSVEAGRIFSVPAVLVGGACT
jgi:hypothetical protein